MYKQIPLILREAGAMMTSAHNIEENTKIKTAHCDLVTIYDTMVQEHLRTSLLKLFPDAGFYGEEEETHDVEGKDFYFIVDPIDGTANFVRGLHHSCISVGLLQKGQMEYAAVYNPYLDEMFTAQRGKGAYLNGSPIHVTDVPMSRSLLLFGSAIYYRETIPATLRFVEELLPVTLDFRRGGSAALDLCYVAAGKGDVFFECCIRPWDYAAGSLIVQEAGGIATALDGNPLRWQDRCSVAAGNSINHAELIALSKKIAAEPDMKGRIR